MNIEMGRVVSPKTADFGKCARLEFSKNNFVQMISIFHKNGSTFSETGKVFGEFRHLRSISCIQ